MGARSIMAGTIAVMAMTSSASAEELLRHCKDNWVEREEFESQGGKLVVTKQPNLAAFSNDFLKICQGHTRFGITILFDGSVTFGPDPKFYPDQDESPVEATHRCWFPLMNRIGEMRFKPSKLNGKPVCVDFNAYWKSTNPHTLSQRP